MEILKNSKNTVFIVSICFNIFLLYFCISTKIELSQIRFSQESLLAIETDLFKMRENLRIPNAVIMNLLPKIIKKESNNNHKATGDGGKSHGAAQIQFPTAEEIMKRGNLTVQDLYNPYINCFLASEYLDQLYYKYGSVKYAISAYNGGLKFSGNVPMIMNENYVYNILK